MSILMGLLVMNCILGLCLRRAKTDNYYKKIFLTLMFGTMIIIAGFRGISVGIDTVNYSIMYETVRDGGIAVLPTLSVQYEWGFLLLTYVLSRIFSSATILFIVCSLITCASFAHTFYKYSSDVVMSSFIFIIWFFPSTMNTMRQYLALSIILFAVKFIERKNLIKYLIVVALATSIHVTASIFFVLAVFTLDKVKINIKTICLSAIGSLIALNFFDLILNVFFKYFSQYQRFMTSSKYTSQSSISIAWIAFYVITAFIFAYVKYLEEKKVDEYTEDFSVAGSFEVENLFCIIYIISIVCMIFSGKLWIATRINSYFRFSICLILPVVMDALNRIVGRFRVFTYTFFYLIFGYLGYAMFLVDGHRLFPFVFVWG